MIERDQLAALQEENARLIALLDGHGIEWRLTPQPIPPEPALPVPEPDSSHFSTAEKVALFRRLFRGRTDVYPIRWESKTTGKSGYSPACGNEWLPLLPDSQIFQADFLVWCYNNLDFVEKTEFINMMIPCGYMDTLNFLA